MDEPEEDRMTLLKKFASLFRGEPSNLSPIGDKPEPVFDTAAIGMIGRAYEAEPAPVVLPLPEQGAKPKPYTVEDLARDCPWAFIKPETKAESESVAEQPRPWHRQYIRIIPIGTDVRFMNGREGKIVGVTVGFPGWTPVYRATGMLGPYCSRDVFPADIAEVISQPTQEITLVIETPKS